MTTWSTSTKKKNKFYGCITKIKQGEVIKKSETFNSHGIMCISIKFLRKIFFFFFLNLINIWLYLKKKKEKKRKGETLKELKKKKKFQSPITRVTCVIIVASY